MKFIHRLGFYLGGFAIGLVILAFFLSGKRASCDYSPDARVLKNIRIKEQAYSESALEKMQLYQIDSTHISTVLNTSDLAIAMCNTALYYCRNTMVIARSAFLKLVRLFEYLG